MSTLASNLKKTKALTKEKTLSLSVDTGQHFCMLLTPTQTQSYTSIPVQLLALELANTKANVVKREAK